MASWCSSNAAARRSRRSPRTASCVPAANPNGSPEPYGEVWAQEIDLPSILSVLYNDPALDFAQNAQQWQRNRGPDPTVPSQNQTVVTLPIAMSADQAIQSAQMLLGEAWMARHTFTATLSPQYLWLTPADPINLALDEYTIRVRISTAAIGADFSTQVTLFAEGAGQYSRPPRRRSSPGRRSASRRSGLRNCSCSTSRCCATSTPLAPAGSTSISRGRRSPTR